MPKRKDIKKVMVIGSGPIVIGQAAEFDYAGTQACLALKEEGYEVILVNSNPATIMTDTHIADKVYMEPLTLEYVAKIIRYERPDAIVPGLGGQTGLNLADAAGQEGDSRRSARSRFWAPRSSQHRACRGPRAVQGVVRIAGRAGASQSQIAHVGRRGGRAWLTEIGYPVVLRPAFTLGGTGGGFADDEAELRELMLQRTRRFARASGAHRKKHQGLQGDRVSR